MKLQLDGCTASYTLEPDEPATAELCNDLIVEAQGAGVLHVDLLIEVTRVNVERVIIESQGFAYAGGQQRNEHNTAVTYCIFRHRVKRSSDGRAAGGSDGLAVAPCPIAPTPIEHEACALMKQRMSEPLSETRLAYLKSLGKQEPAPEKPDPIFDKMRAENAEIAQ